jgi:L-malate glycosyltransferase
LDLYTIADGSMNGRGARPKILIVDNSLGVTGAFKSALAIAESLENSFEIEILLPDTSVLQAEVAAKGFECHRLPLVELGRSCRRLSLYVPRLFGNSIRLQRLLLEREIQMVIVNDYYNLIGIGVKCLGWRGSVITLVRVLPWSQHRLLNFVWIKLGIAFSDRVLAISRAVEKQLPKVENVEFAYDPIPIPRLGFNELRPREDDGTIRFLYLSNYVVGKGQDDALEAFAHAYRCEPRLRLRFVGGDLGLLKNRLYKERLKQKAARMGLGGVVMFSGFSHAIEREFIDSDIVLNFSKSESFSLTCLEAGAYSRPAISTRCGGPEEIIVDGVSGILVLTGDILAMTEAMLRLARERQMRVNMGQAAREMVVRRFNPEDASAKLREIVVACLRRHLERRSDSQNS